MLSAGASGRGLTERFLLLAEKSNLGYRDHDFEHKPCPSLYRRYESLIENILAETKVELRFSDEAGVATKNYIKSIESDLREDGKYSHSLLTGFMGKAT